MPAESESSFTIATPTPIDKQTVIRMNRDTLYSGAVFDLDAGPVTITLPDAGKRFRSMQVINEDEYTPMVIYRPGAVTLTRDKIGTRYVVTAVRTLVDPNDPKDVQQVHALQDALKVEPEECWQVRRTELGPGQPEESTRCIAGAWNHVAGYKGHVRHQGSRSIRCGI